MTLASPCEPLPTGRGAVRTCTCQRRRLSFGMDRMDVELASCAHRRAKVVHRTPHVGTQRYERRKQRGVATWNVRAVVRRSSAPRGQTVQVFYCVKLYRKALQTRFLRPARSRQRPPTRGGPPGTCTLQSCGQECTSNEPNLITTIDADLPTPQTPPSPILMRGGMERPVWCFHPQGLG